MPDQPDLDAALGTAQSWLDSVPGVTAVAPGDEDGQPKLDVWVSGGPPPGLPASVHGVPVRVHDTGGPIDAYAQDPAE